VRRGALWIVASSMLVLGWPATRLSAQQPGAGGGDAITEPALPDNPQSPLDFQGPAAPSGGAGEAAPRGDAGEGGEGAGDGPGGDQEPGGYSGGDMIIGDTRPALYGGAIDRASASGRLPATHIVRPGESLSSISEQYFADASAWPQLWARNKAITNPHWIYPGDRVRLALGDGEPGGATGGGAERGAGPGGAHQEDTLTPVRRSAAVWRGGGSDLVRQRAFVDAAELASAGTIAGAAVERAMLTLHDEVYLKGGDEFRPQPGTGYTIFARRRELTDAGRTVGYVVEVLGEARVKRVSKDRVATAEIVDALSPIERGALVGPLRRSFRRLEPRPARENVEGKILGHLAPTTMIGPDELVFLNRGREAHVEAGNRFLVQRRGDGHRDMYQDLESDNEVFPDETVAEISVIEARDQTSIGVVTRATRELREGDRVRLRRGY